MATSNNSLYDNYMVDSGTGNGTATSKKKQYYRSLDELTSLYASSKPKVTDNADGFNSNLNYWKDYQGELSSYAASHAGDDDFDYARYSLYQSYVDSQLNNAQTAYDNYIINKENSMSAKAQAYNAKDQAAKYAMDSMRANGLGSQGASESALTGIWGAYANGVASADSTEKTANSNLFNTYQASSNNADNTLASNVNAYDTSNENNVYNMVSQELTSGVSLETIKGSEYWAQLTPTQQSVIEQTANASKDTSLQNADKFIGYAGGNAKGYTSADQLSDVKLPNGTSAYASNTIKGLNNELKYLFNDMDMSDVRNGYVVMLQNGKDTVGDSTLYLVYKNGSWYRTTAQAYGEASSDSKQKIRGK